MIDRRTLLLAGVAAGWPSSPRAARPNEALIPLWPGEPPGGGGPSRPLSTRGQGAVRNIAVPTLRVVQPARPNGAAVLVAAGGGYTRVELGAEADPAARWLAERGVVAFVLTYRLPGEGWAAGPLAPLQDAQRALRVIRARAADHGIDANRVGALGFSAGAHLLGLAATRSAFASYRPVDAADQGSARPAAAALVYPVVTLQPPYDRTSTRVQLVGRHPDPAAAAEWSVDTHVGARCPPLFLVAAADDPVADVANSRILADACGRAGIPAELHVLPSGGHGFGMGREGTPSALWPAWYEAWLHRTGALT